jgi:hypothetical protein
VLTGQREAVVNGLNIFLIISKSLNNISWEKKIRLFFMGCFFFFLGYFCSCSWCQSLRKFAAQKLFNEMFEGNFILRIMDNIILIMNYEW